MDAIASRRAGLHSVASALGWLYIYSALWLGAYVLLATVVFGWKPVVITGGSMEPFIDRGDVVMVSRTHESLGRGTVITFQSKTGQGLVTHRVTKVGLDGYRTRGDANLIEDSDVVSRADVYGAGRLLVPLIGRPYTWVRERALVPLGVWVLATAAALAVVSRRSPAPGASQPPAPHVHLMPVARSRRRIGSAAAVGWT